MRLLSTYIVLAAVVPLQAQDADAPLVRLFLVDISASMGGSRIEVVRQEMESLLEASPPAESSPVVVIPFSSRAKAVETFVDPEKAQRWVRKLKANGSGTAIGSGLERACLLLEQKELRSNVELRLYTDGADKDHERIRAAESRLSQMLSKRSVKTGLPQSVFVKSWGVGVSTLLPELSKNSDIRVVDTTELTLGEASLVPSCSVTQVKRHGDRLNVTLSPGIRARGAFGDLDSLEVLFRVDYPVATGETEKVISARRQVGTTLELELPVPADGVEFFMPLKVSIRPASPKPAGWTLPAVHLTADVVHVKVPVPKEQIRNHIQVKVSLSGEPYWSDPLMRLAAFPVTLNVHVQPARAGGSIGSGFTVDVIPMTPCQILAGSTSIRITDAGTCSIPLTIETRPVDAAAPVDEMRFPLAFKLRPSTDESNVAFEPAELPFVRDDLTAPDRITVKVTVSARQLACRWIDAAQGIAIVDYDLTVFISPTLPPRTHIEIGAIEPVLKVALATTQLTASRQKTRLQLAVPLLPFPAKSELSSKLHVSTTPEWPFYFDCPTPLRITAQGPKPAVPSLVLDGRRDDHIELRVPAGATSALLSTTVVISNLADERCCGDIRCVLTSSEPAITIGGPPELVPFRPAEIPLYFPAPIDPPFFQDHRRVVGLTVRPSRHSPAIHSSRSNLHLIHLAPFKRVLFFVSVIVSAAGTMASFVWFAWRLRRPVR